MGIPRPAIDDILARNKAHVCEDPDFPCVRVVAVADLPSRFGEFQVVAFDMPREAKKDHAALVRGDVTGGEDVPVRLHSECLTGDAFGSLRCDCREQLELAMEQIARMPEGVILYLRQEGRGIGFANKIRAYQLQEWGYDTVQANEALGFRADERDYALAAHMLHSLGIKSIRLMSNNPDKARQLEAAGIRVAGRIPMIVPPNPHNRVYLETKRAKSGHLLGEAAALLVPEQVDNAGRTGASGP